MYWYIFKFHSIALLHLLPFQ